MHCITIKSNLTRLTLMPKRLPATICYKHFNKALMLLAIEYTQP